MSAEPFPVLHSVLAAVAAVESALAEVAGVDPLFLGTEEKAAALLGLSAGIDRLEELRMRVLAVADDVAAAEGARDAATWLAHHGRRDRAECRRRLRLGRALAEHESTAHALRDGAISLAQAEVVLDAVDALPDRVGPATRTAAEQRLVDEAARFGPRRLRTLGRRVLDVVAPEVAEELEGRLLAAEEARAAGATFLRRRRLGGGISELVFRGPDAVSDRLSTYLEAFTNPRRPETTGARGADSADGAGDGAADGAADGEDPQGPREDRRPYDQRLGAAFVSFLEAVDPQRLPLHGGDATTVLVTVQLDQLLADLGVATIADEPISAGQARRLACTAGIIPVVLDGAGVVLDAGRTRRLFTPAQRKILAVTQPTCRADGCDIPAAWCEAHHAGRPWAAGGRTDLADGLLLCPFHHHRAHDARYDTRRLPDGRVRFDRRT